MGYIYQLIYRISDNLFKDMILHLIDDNEDSNLNNLAKIIVDKAI